MRDGGRSPQTVALYRAALARFVRWLDGERPGATCADLDHALVDAYVRHLDDLLPLFPDDTLLLVVDQASWTAGTIRQRGQARGRAHKAEGSPILSQCCPIDRSSGAIGCTETRTERAHGSYRCL